MGFAAIVGLIGTGLQVAGSMQAASAQQRMVEEQTAASMRAENAREQQMQLDARQRRRGSIREALSARAMALSAGVAQGAQYGSGVAAGTGGAMAAGAENVNVATQAETLGGRVFQANRDHHQATLRGSRGMAAGQGLQAIGGALVSNAGAIGRLGTFATGGGGRGGSVGPQNPFPGQVPLPTPRPQGIGTRSRFWGGENM